MAKWRLSRERQWRRFWTAAYGRNGCRKPPYGPSSRTHGGKYRRVGVDEQLAIWRVADFGYSARAIARALNRDHHTVSRWLRSERGENLAYDLALRGRSGAAREMLRRLGRPVDLTEAIEKLIAAVVKLRQLESERLIALLPAALFDVERDEAKPDSVEVDAQALTFEREHQDEHPSSSVP